MIVGESIVKLPQILHTISQTLSDTNAKAIVVGGAVRDSLLGLAHKDYDVEVYGLDDIGMLEEVLSRFGSVSLIGKSFGVLKFVYEGEEYDFSLPRTEHKTGVGHRGFVVTTEGSLTYAQAARRRDFTINAVGYDISSGEIIDPFGGREDMSRRVLRHIDDESFVEDPLRVYRAVQFGARFGYELAPETRELCISMVNRGMLDELPRERIFAEWQKLLLKSAKPSIGFEMMRELGILGYYPELEVLIDTPQDHHWHPEGDVWRHTLMAVDAMRSELETTERTSWLDTKAMLRLLFAVLCHDLGKPETTTIEYDESTQASSAHRRIRALGHEQAGIQPTISLMERLTHERSFIDGILPLVEHHLKPSQFYASGAKSAAIRRLATRVNLEELILVAKADFLGRATLEASRGVYVAGEWLSSRARELRVYHKPLDNILRGRDLMELGLEPSPAFGDILNDVYEKYMDGEFEGVDDALGYVRRVYVRS